MTRTLGLLDSYLTFITYIYDYKRLEESNGRLPSIQSKWLLSPRCAVETRAYLRNAEQESALRLTKIAFKSHMFSGIQKEERLRAVQCQRIVIKCARVRAGCRGLFPRSLQNSLQDLSIKKFARGERSVLSKIRPPTPARAGAPRHRRTWADSIGAKKKENHLTEKSNLPMTISAAESIERNKPLWGTPAPKTEIPATPSPNAEPRGKQSVETSPVSVSL